MNESWRPGDFRICRACGARAKAIDAACPRCGEALAGAPLQHGAPVAAALPSPPRLSRALRGLLAGCLVVALAFGVWVRHLFRGVDLDDAVNASSRVVTPAVPPGTDPGWTPPTLAYPYQVGALPSGHAPVAVPVNPIDPISPVNPAAPAVPDAPGPPGAAAPGLVSIAPRTVNQPTPQTSFTDADLAHTRAEGAVGGTTPAAMPVAADETARREWSVRIRDREDEVREARSRARRVEAQIEALRARSAASAADFDAHQKVEREIMDALDDLDKAERGVSKAERALDEAKDGAQRAGFRIVEKE